MSARIHPSHSEAEILGANGHGSKLTVQITPKPLVFRKLFGISQSDLMASEHSSVAHRSRGPASDPTSRGGAGRRKSFDGMPSSSSAPTLETAVEEEEAVELVLLNKVSSTLSELKRHDETAWKEFTALTTTVFNQVKLNESHDELRTILLDHGFTVKHGWPAHDVDINALLQHLSNIYITMQHKHSSAHDSHNKIKNIQSLTFCPNILFSNFPHEFSEQPCSRSFASAVLLADISGFSKFAGEMCLRGARGLDVLHKVTSDFLGHFVHTVYDFDGDVIAFAGDALICIFPASDIMDQQEGSDLLVHRTIEQACLQALRCAYCLRDHKMHSLSAHFAVSCGPIQVALLGGVNGEWTYLMNGACISELTHCIDNAPPQNVVCTRGVIDCALDVQPTIKAIYQKKWGTFLIDNIELFDHVDHDSPMEVEERIAHAGSYKSARLLNSDKGAGLMSLDEGDLLPLLVKKAAYFIPRPVLNAMSADSLNSIAELRQITTMFLNLDSYSLEENVDPVSLQPFFLLLQEVLLKSGGFLRQFLIDDKGCVAIAMWGVPSYTHNNDCSRGLYCAWNMSTRVAELNHRCSIGLTTGHAYCGIVGSNFRRDYACIGDKVNIAARLMAKANGSVLVDPEVMGYLDSKERNALVRYHELRLKGMPGPMTPFTFGTDVDLSVLRSKEEESGASSVLRKEVIRDLLAVLDKITSTTPYLSKLKVSDRKFHTSDLKTAILIGPDIELQNPIPDEELAAPVSNEERIIETSAHEHPAMEEMNRVIVLSGMSGTGKTTAAQFFRQTALRRKLRTVYVQCRSDDESSPYSIVRRIFWDLVGRKKIETDDKKREFLDSLMETARKDNMLEPSLQDDSHLHAMHEVLINDLKRIQTHKSVEQHFKTASANGLEPVVKATPIEKEMTGPLTTREDSDKDSLWKYPEQTAELIVTFIQIVLARHASHNVVIIEEVQFCDECSWFLLFKLQRNPMKMVMLLTVQRSIEHVTSRSRSTGKPAIGSAGEELKVASQSSVNRDNALSSKGQQFEQCASYRNIIENSEFTTVIDMKELNSDEVRQVLNAVTEGEVSKQVVHNVHNITSGNAFWVKSIAKFIKEYGDHDFIQKHESGQATDALKNLIIIRMEKLSTEDQLVVKHASVLGQEFTVRTLAAVLPETIVPRLSQALQALHDLGFIYCIEEAPLAVYGFHNMLTRDTIYNILPPSDASEIHLSAALYIEDKYSEDLHPFYIILGYHYSHAIGFHDDAFKYTVKAADQAIGKGAYQLGLELLTSAMELTRHDNEIKLLHDVVTTTLHDIVRMSGKHSRVRLVTSEKSFGDRGSDRDSITEKDGITEYRRLLNQLEQPRNFHHHGHVHDVHGQPAEAHPGLLAQLKQRSVGSFMSAFGDFEGSNKGTLGFQLSYTKLGDEANKPASPKKGVRGTIEAEDSKCSCTIS